MKLKAIQCQKIEGVRREKKKFCKIEIAKMDSKAILLLLTLFVGMSIQQDIQCVPGYDVAIIPHPVSFLCNQFVVCLFQTPYINTCDEGKFFFAYNATFGTCEEGRMIKSKNLPTVKFYSI